MRWVGVGPDYRVATMRRSDETVSSSECRVAGEGARQQRCCRSRSRSHACGCGRGGCVLVAH